MRVSFYSLIASAALAAASTQVPECVSKCQAAHWNQVAAEQKFVDCLESSSNLNGLDDCLLAASSNTAMVDCMSATCAPEDLPPIELRRRHGDEDDAPTSNCLSVCESRITESESACTDKSYIKHLFTCVLASCPTEGELSGSLTAFYAECHDVPFPAPAVFLSAAGVNAKTVDVPSTLSGVTVTATAFPASVTENASKTKSGSASASATAEADSEASASGSQEANASGTAEPDSGAASLKNMGGFMVAAVLSAALMML
ncbi:hypothetical protein EDC01DRAFT_658102 [Geopyxis carbonaria]|nr:hypothetical protein EDC01DRAFT_658102 [Geopyxis carbonaria]